MKFTHHEEASRLLNASSVDEAFSALDEHARVSSHMDRPSWRMAWRRRVLGILLYCDEVITVRDPPRRKVWETVGPTRLVMIGSYRMGYELEPEATGSRLTVFIDYNLPGRGISRLLGLFLDVSMPGGAPGRWSPTLRSRRRRDTVSLCMR